MLVLTRRKIATRSSKPAATHNMETGNLLKVVNQEVEDFKSKRVQVVPGFSFNQYETVNRNHFYYNGKFTDYGETLDPVDEDGDRIYFQNINKNPCKIFTKAIDFDTKNIRLLTVGGGNPTKTWFMERDLKFWMRDKQFGKILNRTFKELPIFGSVVLKIIDGTPYFVDLRNFVVEPGADDLDSTNYIIEIHNYSIPEFRRVAKAMKWDKAKVDQAIDEFRKMKNTSHLKVIERYGELPIFDDSGLVDYRYQRLFVADVGIDEYDRDQRLSVEKMGVVLERQDWDGHPYREFHAEKMPGRWLGIGVVESLYEPQIRINELSNLQTKSSYWSALRLFQTRDQAVNRNLATDVKNGEVITTDSEITPINMDDRNLAFFDSQYTWWLKNRDELTFSYDVVQGERLPAGTPLGSAQIAQAQTLSYFEQIQENIAMDFKEMLYEDIIPHFQKENTAEHTLRLVGEDLDQYVSMVKNELVAKEIVRLAMRSLSGQNPFPTNKDRDLIGVAVEESIKQGKEKLLTIPKDFYKGVKYDVDIDITGESVDTRVRAATKFAIAQMITADPDMLVNPVKRKLLASYAEDGGISAADFFEVPQKKLEDIAPTPGRAGGGVSAPQLNVATTGPTAQTV